VRAIHRTASANSRLFLPLRPGSPGFPRQCGYIFAHWASVKTNRSIKSLNHNQPPMGILNPNRPYLSRRRERDDRGLGKLSAPLSDIDSIEESSSIIAEAQERDAADERRLDDLLLSDRPGLINGSGSMGSNVKAMRQRRLRLE